MELSAVIVNRVSSARQEEGFSLEAQQELNERYCTQKKLDLVRIFTFAESAGDQKQRQEFEKVLRFIKEKGVRHLVLEKTDRLMRNMTDYVSIQEQIRAGLTVHLVKENLVLHKESGSTETFLFDINVVIAKRFLANLSEETRKGLNRKVRSGGYPMRAPYGYDMVEKKLRLNKDGAIVAEIFQLYASGTFSTITLARYLTEQGVLPPRGKDWHAQTVHKILTNPAYIGKIRWKGQLFGGVHPVAVERDVWDRVAAVLSDSTHSKTEHEFALGKLVKLYNGRSMSGEIQKGHTYYTGWITARGRRVYMREEEIFEQLNPLVENLAWTEAFSTEVLEASRIVLRDIKQDLEPKIKSIEKRLAETRGKIARLLDIRLTGQIEKDIFDIKNAELHAALAANERELAATKQTDSEVLAEITKIAETFLSLPKIYASASPAGKGAILRDLVEKIVVNEDRTVTLHYSEPFSFFISPEIFEAKSGPADAGRIHHLMRPVVDELRTWLAAA